MALQSDANQLTALLRCTKRGLCTLGATEQKVQSSRHLHNPIEPFTRTDAKDRINFGSTMNSGNCIWPSNLNLKTSGKECAQRFGPSTKRRSTSIRLCFERATSGERKRNVKESSPISLWVVPNHLLPRSFETECESIAETAPPRGFQRCTSSRKRLAKKHPQLTSLRN